MSAILVLTVFLFIYNSVRFLVVNFDPNKTIFLIDGSSFLYRAYYGMRPLHSPDGKQVQAVYSFCRMIRSLIKKFNMKYVALVWDSKGKTTRHEMFQDYKATRQAPPSDIFEQKELIQEFSDLIDLFQIAKSGIEADDIIYSLVQDFKKTTNDCVVVSSDKDLGQMIDEKTYMFDSFKDVLFDVKSFEDKMGFEIKKLPFYFSLLGDASDNIPGVRGVGKKGAFELVTQFESLESLYNNLDEVEKKRQKTALEKNKENAFLSRDLFLLQYHTFKIDKQDLLYSQKNWDKAQPFFIRLDFKSLLTKLSKEKVSLSQQNKDNYAYKKYTCTLVDTVEKLQALCELLKKEKAFALDTETTGINVLQEECIGISICCKKGEAFYIPFGHETGEKQLTKKDVVDVLGQLLKGKNYKKYLHHAKFDQLALLSLNIELQGVAFDTLIAAKLVTKSWQSCKLEELSQFYFDELMLTYEQTVKNKGYKNFSQVPLKDATNYAAVDAHQTFQLVDILQKELQKKDMFLLYKAIELPLVQVLFAMEKKGIGFDASALKKLDEKVTRDLRSIEQMIKVTLGSEHEAININSPKQVEYLLFEVLHLPPQKKKKTGYSTDQEVLKTLAKLHPVPGLIMQYRELFKLKTTYIDALPTYINQDTKRIHTSFNQTLVATGRLSSSNPNLQNVPSYGVGFEIRSAFVPKKDYVFLSADYSQIELRVLAQLCQDKNLIDAFLSNQDIHSKTASHLFGVTIKDVSKEQRQIGKRINFSVLYGLTPYGLSKDLGISFSDAKKYIESYFANYSGVAAWMETVVEETKKNGLVTTMWGRTRDVPGIYERNKNLYDAACRVAINTVAQGTAAEIMKQAMIAVEKVLLKKGYDAAILLQIHDELLIEGHKDQIELIQADVVQAMQSVVNWTIPLVVSSSIGKDWKEASK